MSRRPIAMLCLGILVACGIVEEPPTSLVRFEVWNRTEMPIFLLSEGGLRLDVPACGRAVAAFDTNQVEVRAAGGYIFTFGAPVSHVGLPAEMRQPARYLVVTAESTRSGPGADGIGQPSTDLPAAMPPCEGVPQIQPGV